MTDKKDKEQKLSKKSDNIERTIVTSISKIAGTKPKRVYLFFLAGPLLGKLFPLEEGTTVIGRNPEADIVIDDTRVSRNHLQIVIDGEKATIHDLGSTNGTFINGEKVKDSEMHAEDKIQISPATIFKFSLADEDEKIAFDELYELGVIDPLTNAYNKRYFIDRLKEELSHAKRLDDNLSLLMIDLDYFKKINDTHGHLAGDYILIKLTKTLQSLTRHEDIVARYGGEEFVVILRNTGEEGSELLAERIRSTIDSNPVKFEDKEIHFTISIGIATADKNHRYRESNEFIGLADKCLYYSKEHGRNRTTTMSKLK